MKSNKTPKMICWLLSLALILSLTGCAFDTGDYYDTGVDKPAYEDSIFENRLPSASDNVAAETPTPNGESEGGNNEKSPGGEGSESAVTSTLQVTFLDVGQGDSALLSCGGEHLLIDGGDTKASDIMYTALKNRGVEYIDVIVATHRDADHVGGLAGALNYASAGVAYCSTTEHTSKAFNNMVKYLGEDGVKLQIPEVGTQFYIGEALVTVIGPVKEYDDPNDNSIVLRVDFGSTSFLFTGDMEETAEKDLIASGANLDVDVLKVGHHGSSTSTTYEFLYLVDPDYAVISCGANNSYGHPHESVLSKLRDADVELFRTDLQGDIVCISDGTTLTWTTDRNASAGELNPTIPK